MGTLANPITPVPQISDSDVPLLPTRMRQGDSWNFNLAFLNYSSALYNLALVFNSPSNRFAALTSMGGSPPITADEDGESFDVQATSAQTGACQPDTYEVAAILTGITGKSAAGQQVTLVLQFVAVDPNLAGASGPVDTRSLAKKNLDAINAALANNADPSVQRYMINGRELGRFPRVELLKERAYWSDIYDAERRARGEYVPSKTIGFRFGPNL